MNCPLCHQPRVPDAPPGSMHPWCYRAAHGWQPAATDVEMVACGPQCHHAPGAEHGVYLYTSGEKMLMARVRGHYPAGSQEVTVASDWDVA
jgi:hypothetical protein